LYSPIVLFTYNRLEHLRATLESLAANQLANDSDLIIYSDNAVSVENRKLVDAVRAYLKTVKGFRSVIIRERDHNFGLAASIIAGVTEVLASHERVIVLEDDLVTSPNFLTYMNGALDKYALDERVASIHGYLPPVRLPVPETFFMRGADCWGWGVWRRSWQLFNSNGQKLVDELKEKKLLKLFDLGGAVANGQMLLDQINGRNNSWAIRWHASIFISNKLTLYPGRSLVHNIGLDDTGTHCQATNSYDTLLTETSIDLADIAVEPSALGVAAFTKFHTENKKKNENWIIRL
jgi:glycosyltransferase involved in cell wall biosynthesis